MATAKKNKKPAAKKKTTAKKKPVAKKAAAKKTTVKKKTVAKKKPAAKKTVAKKAAPKKKATAKKATANKKSVVAKKTPYQVTVGPAGYLPPAAASMGVDTPKPSHGLIEGKEVSKQEAMERAAKEMLTRPNPTVFPGPLVLWGDDEHTQAKAAAVIEIAKEIPNCRIIPMPDYRPKYPKIDPEAEINPNHPNLTILHNRIEACIFVGVHCHYANLTLKMIRAGTNCFTIALCAECGHEDAMTTLRDQSAKELLEFADVVRKMRKKMGIKWTPTLPPANPSLTKENYESVGAGEFGEFAPSMIPRRAEVITDTE